MSEENLGAFVLELEGADKQLEAELNSAFPDAIVSPANNFLGGLTIAVLLQPAKDALESVLKFTNQWHDRYKDATITIEKKKISLKGYKPGDAIKILKSAGFMPAEEGSGTKE